MIKTNHRTVLPVLRVIHAMQDNSMHMALMMQAAQAASVVGAAALIVLVGTLIWYAVALGILKRRGEVSVSLLPPSYAMFASFGAGLLLFTLSGIVRNIALNVMVGIIGAILLTLPGIVCAVLLAKKVLPKQLKAPAWPIAISAAILAPLFCFGIGVASQSLRIMAYNNTDMAQVRGDLAQNPNDAAAHFSLARLYISQKNRPAALSELQQVVRIEPDNTEALLILSMTLSELGRKEEARQVYTRLAAHSDDLGRSARKHLAKQTQLIGH